LVSLISKNDSNNNLHSYKGQIIEQTMIQTNTQTTIQIIEQTIIQTNSLI